ncbi:methyltransferase domain-containing protein [Streptomyces malaysiensis]|uniref:Protein-L-isoaspartate O-methyltransferase n=1 Tax=Streptomyces malaysiensis TaxID=92644 RepID=A0A7X5X279_STRMQ|nr:methyltransferase domain-containing protein [Streptomyces malaysiensis]NIY65278.1 protein-L-isoaspartate(D-aspartate) O-methyltransferase [Streptomyces malaysiensis]
MNEDWRPRHAALVEALSASGALPDAWRPAFAAVPRHHFIPGDIWEQRATCVPVTTDAAWWDLVYRDVPIVTQVDDGRSDGPGIATSSNSMPTMVARMLTALEVADGQCVLEIGTGSGWNAALLAARLGSGNVTTVEVDPVLAEKAAKVIEEAGYNPDVVWGDGARGWESGAPYDRIIATCSVRRIPYAWVRQTMPGGRILAPLAGDFWSGTLVRLDVAGDGIASGRFIGGARFMPMRSERPGPDLPVDSGTGRRGSTGALPADIMAGLGFALYAGARLPGVVMADGAPDGRYQIWLHDRKGSAATVTQEEVWQYGPRPLWEEATAVHNAYVKDGSPDVGDFGLTVSPDGQRLWLRSPDALLG